MDYQSFVALARGRLEAELDLDVGASELALALNRAAGILTDAAEATVHRPNGLVWSQFRLMFTLWVLGDVEQARLSGLTSSHKATVSNIIGSLTRRGLIERREADGDRRTKMIRLTADGEQCVRSALLAQDALFVEWSSALTQAERDTFVHLLGKLMERHVMTSGADAR